ncbi:NAD(+)/NADH kinase [Fodinisporobacter ferrooxydans]|uniref:NAD kinase n=1 Tax=Fodinisporobacter ferrooxydans TaxID=2901836 RepID=A0ABY4CKY3_9BACL|nr:NAD(+)/NADH kinase [Alicyclobacillaceae bacterium MYW30-H2]
MVALTRIGLIVNRSKPRAFEISREIIQIIEGNGEKVYVEAETAKALGRSDIQLPVHEFAHSVDLVFVLGGDGTLLGVARQLAHAKLPVLGINLGHLGFLAEAEPKDLHKAIERIIRRDYSLEERLMLEVEVVREGKSIGTWIGLNDVGIAKRSFGRMVNVRVFVDSMYVDEYSGDGVIVSSPTGSTAYSLSCGGPIVSPQMNAIVVTPISPHTLVSRPFLVSGEQTVKVEVCSTHNDIGLTVDGQVNVPIQCNDVILVRKSTCSTLLVKWQERGFFNVLRTKLHMNPMSEQRCEGNE